MVCPVLKCPNIDRIKILSNFQNLDRMKTEHRQDKDFIEFSEFPMPEQRKIEKWTIFFKS